MGILVTKSFKVDSDSWAAFEEAARQHGATPAQLFRELVENVDAALQGIQDSRTQSFDGNFSQLIKSQFPQLSPFQLHAMAQVLNRAAELAEKQPGSANPKKLGFGLPDHKDVPD